MASMLLTGVLSPKGSHVAIAYGPAFGYHTSVNFMLKPVFRVLGPKTTSVFALQATISIRPDPRSPPIAGVDRFTGDLLFSLRGQIPGIKVLFFLHQAPQAGSGLLILDFLSGCIGIGSGLPILNFLSAGWSVWTIWSVFRQRRISLRLRFVGSLVR